MTFTAKVCWSCKGRRHVQVRSKPIEMANGEKIRLVTGPAIKQGCWFCRGTGYLNAARIKEYQARQRRLHAIDAVIIARLAERRDALQDK